MGRITEEVMKEREDYVVELIKTSDTPITGKIIDTDLNIKPGTRWAFMKKIRQKYPEIKERKEHTDQGARILYYWEQEKKPEPKEIKIPQRNTYRTFREQRYKNAEGYSDMTAGKAIENVSKEDDVVAETDDVVIPNNVLPKAGEVWSTSESNGTIGYIYVLNSLNRAAQCVKLHTDTSDIRSRLGDSIFSASVEGKPYVGDPTHVTFKPLRYCMAKVDTLPDAKLMEVRKAVGQALNILAFRTEVKEVIKEVPVEKIVYKEKEPDESIKIPETYVDVKDAKIVYLEGQLEVYKMVATKLLDAQFR